MPMTFEEAEARFKELQARVQRGEPISRAEYEEEVGKLAVQDRNGVLWEINPRTGKWMYFDGAEWVSGAPPGRDSSTVMPVPKEVAALKSTPAPTPTPSTPAPSAPVPSEPPPLVRAESKPAARAPAAPAAKPAPSTPRAPRPAATGRRREWIPLAIASVVLLLCAATLLVTAQVVLPIVNPKPTPTRVIAITRAPTPLPQPTLMPTPTPIPPTPAPVIAKVTATTLNIRAEPNSKSARLGVLRRDNQVTFLAQTRGEQIEGSNVWYLINIPNSNQQGWVFFGNNFQIISGDPKTLPTPKP